MAKNQAVAYIQIVSQQMLSDLEGKVSISDLSRECNKRVTAHFIKEVVEACGELNSCNAYFAKDNERMATAESAVLRTMDNLATLLKLHMDSRITVPGLALVQRTGDDSFEVGGVEVR